MEKAVETFLKHLEQDKQYSENTVAAYRNDLSQFIEFLAQKEPESWRQLRKQDILSYELHLKDRRYAQSTVARKLASVRSFCHYLTEQRIVSEDPVAGLDSPPVDRKTPRTLSDREVSMLLELPGRMATPKGLRDRAILEMLYATGMRVSELTALDISDVDLRRSKVRCGEGDSERSIALSRASLEALRAYTEQARDQLLSMPEEQALFVNHRGERLSRQGLWLVIKHYVKRLGLEEDITPHTLRHSAAAHKLRKGTNISELQHILGHSSPSSTQIYARIARQS